MKKMLVSVIVAGLMTALGAGAASAQDKPPLMIPVDILACKYNEGKGPADLDAVVADWQEWVGTTEYDDDFSAWSLTKHYAGPEQEFDFLWLLAWRNGDAMGGAWGEYMENGGEIAAKFGEMSNCPGAANFVSINHRPTPNNNTPGDGVLVFSDCMRKDGMSNQDVGRAMGQWSALLDSRKLDVGIFHWYPVFGGGGEPTFHFKEIYAFENLQKFGNFYESMTNGGLYRDSQAITGPVMDCDVARVYNAKNRLSNNIRK
ncbi:MAG: hypothetical protein KJO31_07840 [Gammaproteobacteria bacterium]|nr:hypothetical protein [Gammaproteobacteria bacterium]